MPDPWMTGCPEYEAIYRNARDADEAYSEAKAIEDDTGFSNTLYMHSARKDIANARLEGFVQGWREAVKVSK